MELHWYCSGFSANFIMRRTSIAVLVFLALFASAAYGSRKPRVSTATATTAHKRAPHSATRAASRRKPVRMSPTPHAYRSRHALKAASAVRPNPSPEAYTPSERPPAVEPASLTKTRLVMPPPLRGSHESLVRQNQKSEETDSLERIEDDEDLANRIASKMLVPVPVSSSLAINGSLPDNRRYCRPWTANFLADLARAHAARFHAPLLVTSAVRTVAYQKQLERVNGNAAAAEGDIASPHLTGATIDIAKQGLSRQQIAWMRARLLSLQDAGKIDVEEEFHQACFHITVYKSYVPPMPPRKTTMETAASPSQPKQSESSRSKPKQPKHEQAKPAQPKPSQPEPTQSEDPVEGF
jgi:uncharacterized protein YcbK (DUF882 family)